MFARLTLVCSRFWLQNAHLKITPGGKEKASFMLLLSTARECIALAGSSRGMVAGFENDISCAGSTFHPKFEVIALQGCSRSAEMDDKQDQWA